MEFESKGAESGEGLVRIAAAGSACETDVVSSQLEV